MQYNQRLRPRRRLTKGASTGPSSAASTSSPPKLITHRSRTKTRTDYRAGDGKTPQRDLKKCPQLSLAGKRRLPLAGRAGTRPQPPPRRASFQPAPGRRLRELDAIKRLLRSCNTRPVAGGTGKKAKGRPKRFTVRLKKTGAPETHANATSS